MGLLRVARKFNANTNAQSCSSANFVSETRAVFFARNIIYKLFDNRIKKRITYIPFKNPHVFLLLSIFFACLVDEDDDDDEWMFVCFYDRCLAAAAPRAQRTCNEMRAINHHFAQIPSKVSWRRRALAMRLSKYYFLSKHKVYLYTQFAWLAFFCAEEKKRLETPKTLRPTFVFGQNVSWSVSPLRHRYTLRFRAGIMQQDPLYNREHSQGFVWHATGNIVASYDIANPRVNFCLKQMTTIQKKCFYCFLIKICNLHSIENGGHNNKSLL